MSRGSLDGLGPSALRGTRSRVDCAASSLLRDLLDGSHAQLVEVARTRTSVHYETGRADVPVLCIGAAAAVRLPASLISPSLPTEPLQVLDGALISGGTRWQVVRWWTPPRPVGLTPPLELPWPKGVSRIDVLRPDELVGSGPGLTPSGDDVLAGALVAGSAVADPRLAGWRADTVAALTRRRTTAVSRALLHHALTGWATPELADFVTAACAGEAYDQPLSQLLAVGHTSGAALASGALHVLDSHVGREAA